MKTYTFLPRGVAALLREARSLYHIHSRHVSAQIEESLFYLRRVEQRVEHCTGTEPAGQDVLIVGTGQGDGELVFFGRKNRAVGIDLDVVARGFSLRTYVVMLRRNGPMRAAKTLARKCLCLDARARRAFKKALGIRRFPKTTILQMDAARMSFADNSFDFVYSSAVFEHLPDPAAAIAEVNRVLRPGGACYISLHLYTSDGGCHDPRVFADTPDRPPYWSHLRPLHRDKVQPNAYLNELRLAQWQRLFREQMPGVSFEIDGFHAELDERLRAELSQIRAGGELADYTDEELLAVNLVAVWQKPEFGSPTKAVVPFCPEIRNNDEDMVSNRMPIQN